MAPRYDGQDQERFQRLAQVAGALGVPTVATALPFLHHGRRRRLADVLTAIRLGLRVDKLGRRALPNNEGRLRSRGRDAAAVRGARGGGRAAPERWPRARPSRWTSCSYEYPSEIAGGETAAQRLARLAEAGLRLALSRRRARAGTGADGA